MVLRQRIFLSIVLAANAVLWAVPSDVVELIARDRQTLLGRYSREHFTLNVAVLIASLVGLYIDRAPADRYRRRWFQVIATLVFLVPAVLVLDVGARALRPTHYVKDGLAYHRPANVTFTETFIDRPEALRTYPNAPAGYGAVTCTYHADADGFRNGEAYEACDVVVLGDSFVEGSKVSDEHAWPYRLAELTGLTVCNLGMSGYSPWNYSASLKRYGMTRSPRVVICTLYEGNDFRVGEAREVIRDPGWSDRVQDFVKQSPIVEAIDRVFIRTFGPIGADRHVPGIELLDWLPLAVPPGPGAKYYAFAPKQLLQSRVSIEGFRASGRWKEAAEALAEIQGVCDGAGAVLVVAFAPSKAHVVLPLAGDGLPAQKVRAFAALRADSLPPANEFVAELLSTLSSKETVVADWCAARDVPFVSMTDALRRHASQGDQVYYTYDQHWTPIGHEVVAATVASFLGKEWRLPKAAFGRNPREVTEERGVARRFGGGGLEWPIDSTPPRLKPWGTLHRRCAHAARIAYRKDLRFFGDFAPKK